MDWRKTFSFSINSFNEHKNKSVNDIFTFINTGKIAQISGVQNITKNKLNNILSDKSKIIFSKMKKNKSYFKTPLSSFSKNISFDQKYYYDNSNNNLFGNNNQIDKKKKYVYEHYNKVFNLKQLS